MSDIAPNSDGHTSLGHQEGHQTKQLQPEQAAAAARTTVVDAVVVADVVVVAAVEVVAWAAPEGAQRVRASMGWNGSGGLLWKTGPHSIWPSLLPKRPLLAAGNSWRILAAALRTPCIVPSNRGNTE